MTHYETTGSGGPGERWNVNLPAVIGVVFVFLVGVIVWVVASGDDDPAASSDVATTVTEPTVNDGDTTVLTTTPAMPDVSATAPTTAPTDTSTSFAETTVETTVAPSSTTVPVTTAPGADPDAVPGDLAIPGHPMQRPGCDASYITIVASAVGDQATATGIGAQLDTYPNSSYLRTDQTCSSLRSDVDGEPIYVVYFGPFAMESDACTARADGPSDAYAKQLSNDVPPDQVVNCG